MSKVIVNVALKPEILDPQGQAIGTALTRLGFDFAREVRQGKRFEIEIDGALDDAKRKMVEEVAHKLLSNPVIETFTIEEMN
jgi:phosphoribosylformylglycinamidine synthase subunit PurS